MKTALIIGHAGHELRVLKFIRAYQPLIIVLTDGSGSRGASRIDKSKRIFDSHGCKISSVFGEFSDKEIYRIITTQDHDTILSLKEKIKKELINNNITLIFGDACEGFNPTHDLCRYLINGCVNEISKTQKIKNYDFLLDLPHALSDDFNNLYFELNEEDLFIRERIIKDYPELKFEVQKAKERFGDDAFNLECLREVEDTGITKTWNGDKPFYEAFGEKRKNEGLYSEIITYEKHLLPLAQKLL